MPKKLTAAEQKARDERVWRRINADVRSWRAVPGDYAKAAMPGWRTRAGASLPPSPSARSLPGGCGYGGPGSRRNGRPGAS